jgi:hypothetical protein
MEGNSIETGVDREVERLEKSCNRVSRSVFSLRSFSLTPQSQRSFFSAANVQVILSSFNTWYQVHIPSYASNVDDLARAR